MLTLYGIKNCDRVKKAKDWLTNKGVEFQFHDFRKDGIDAGTLQRWLDAVGSETLVNQQSRTWRTLDDGMRHQCNNVSPIPILLTHPTLIRRPVLVDEQRLLVGFDETQYIEFLSTSE